MRIDRMRMIWAAPVAALLVGVLALTPAASAASGRVNPRAAAITCATRRALNARVGPGQAGRLRNLVTCLLRAERRQAGFALRQTPQMSHLAGAGLGQLLAASDGSLREQAHAIDLVTRSLVSHSCARRRGLYVLASGDTSGTGLTALGMARYLDPSNSSDRALRDPRAVFGIATAGRLLFSRRAPGTAYVVFAVSCP